MLVDMAMRNARSEPSADRPAVLRASCGMVTPSAGAIVGICAATVVDARAAHELLEWQALVPETIAAVAANIRLRSRA